MAYQKNNRDWVIFCANPSIYLVFPNSRKSTHLRLISSLFGGLEICVGLNRFTAVDVAILLHLLQE
jgi:hypothetical protein